MRQAKHWRLIAAAVFTSGMLMSCFAAAQEVLDPGPVADDQAIESDLPSPGRAADGAQLPRDFSRAFLGVTFEPSIKNAAVALSVNAGSPADQAGVKAGDTIVALNGRQTQTYDDVLRTVASLKAGDVLDIEISRRVSVRARAVLDGQPFDAQHTTGYRPAAEPLPAPVIIPSRPRVETPNYLNVPRQRPTYTPQQNPNTQPNRSNTNRNNNSNDQDNGRGRFLRRR